MEKVAYIGGVFFKIMDPTTLGAWYPTHRGTDVEQWGGAKLR